ncbi:tRNA-splicing ligase RtcB [Amycolatopsis bartoniae]|uniref:3'-phosphate/5'-hydroxy nucleic acid ligase n=1 Tax=Amycolatopsis bartoniae TaxID=941986 RepID=A0A8H9MBC2_9PSEU|nr:RtcB family protein [Amycolatopsis bartoniae]MBB2936035.1 tRNA-splicing ligase RtcB [Amycolatopsis bartoniae]TVT00887.1 RtcB family protein [Amycolatopsis bartoniae]GHF63661.1 RNA-splicing ligase RtcB [Amycolatopsis bartoniae]
MHAALEGARVPIRIWADPASVEEAAMRQLRNVANLPWVHGLAVMPDVHYGKGATVGSVIAMRDAVSPAAVGVDIGCGMSAVRTSLTASDLPDDLGRLRRRIESAVPVGFSMHKTPVDPARVPGSGGWDRFWSAFGALHPGVQNLRDRARAQVGSLGGGNHFIEVCLEQGGADEGRVWLMLHSGSRGIGNELAKRHIDVARSLPHNADLPDRDLAVFVAGTPEMAAYRRDLFWAQDYAARNRATMVALVQRALADEVPGVRFDEPISCHHNYVAEETYDGVDVLVTRKGAIRAGSGDLGIIPGSMGTGSYIVRGLGNESSFLSASHGAGRRMSRTKARKTFTAADLAAQTSGVECRKDDGVVDEIPAAYKDIDSVIAAQTDLVEVVAHLKQVVCVKG